MVEDLWLLQQSLTALQSQEYKGEEMGIFKKKKKEEETNVKWDDILHDINSPDIPEELPQWFEDAAVNPTELKTLARNAYIWPNSWINIETAAMFVGTRIPEPCDEGDASAACKKCGRNSSNYLSIMTANRDCDILGWSLASSKQLSKLGVADGAFFFFDPAVYGTLRNEEEFEFESQPFAPVKMGEIEIADCGDATGTMFFGDANGAIDGNYFFGGIPVLAGKYQIIGWLGYTSTGELAPQAIGIYGKGFDSVLESDLRTALDMTPTISDIIAGTGDGTVLARMGNNQAYFAEQNHGLNSGRHPIPESWSLQVYFEESPEEAFRTAEELNLDELMMMAEGMRMRGKRDYYRKLADIALRREEVTNDPDLFISIQEFINCPVGVFRKLEINVREKL